MHAQRADPRHAVAVIRHAGCLAGAIRQVEKTRLASCRAAAPPSPLCHVSTTCDTMTLPYVVDAQTSLSAAEVQVLHDQYETEAASGHITTQTKFNYAWALIKSQDRQQMLQGVALLTGTSVQPRSHRHLPHGPRTPPRVPLLLVARPLQTVQLRRGKALQWYVHAFSVSNAQHCCSSASPTISKLKASIRSSSRASPRVRRAVPCSRC